MQTKLTRSCLSAAFAGAFATVLAATLLAQAPDPHVGTWKLNPAKSKYSPGPTPKSGTTKIEAAGAGTKVVVDQILADGSVRHWEVTANYDGKDAPVTGNPDADTMARTRVDANTVKSVSKKGGKVTTTQTSAVSSDGKTRTVTTTGTNGAGQTVNNVAVYDKQ
jgi:hypothetical protein